jgi:hypothetical protein
MPPALADDKVALWLDLWQESLLSENLLLDLNEFTVRPMDRAMKVAKNLAPRSEPRRSGTAAR